MNLSDIENAFRNKTPSIQDIHTRYAVLVPLVDVEGEPHLLYEVRSERLKSQPGEVCFPGGAVEPGEDPEDCAVRETMEELSIPPHAIRILSPLDYIHYQGVFMMHPYLGIVSYDAVRNLSVNEDEVKEAFLVPIRYLLAHEPFIYQYDMVPDVGPDFPYERIHCKDGYCWRRGKMEVPIYNYGAYAIWGITGRITRSFLWAIKAEGAS
ncbi:MAG: CoA pyrophosphatase [Oscillospiraceae bacterium]|nr:CoA pyrophosphatase [Oscillospiraceae bacterium]